MAGSTRTLVERELDQLRASRDQLRLQAHLGRMEARELVSELEDRFEDVESRVRRLARESGEALEEAGDDIGGALEDLREGYERLRKKLANSGTGEGLWLRVCVAIDQLMSQGARATERVVDSLEDLGESARLRVENARRERELLEKCAALGTEERLDKIRVAQRVAT
jgi:SMC interacting uncharacterized protein involved in chromosome segregation